LFKRVHHMHRYLQQKGTRRATLTEAGRQTEGLSRESTGPADKIPSAAHLGGNRMRTELGVLAHSARDGDAPARSPCRSAIRES
jgi:hypothetical protein